MKKILTVIIIGLLCFSMFLTIGVPAAQATVETGWPVSQPNIPRNADDIFIDFEDGIEGIEIESSNPNLKFTTTHGLNWRYGDIRTGGYNVYPYGSQAYECRGNFFAWLGVTGDAGRIDFLGGAATYCSILVSTYSGVVVDAYNSDNELISTSGWAGSNVNTRTFTRLTVDAPVGDYISYVIVHDTGNYWLLDDLCTDAKPAVIPVPGRSIGDHSDRFDLVFVPDNDYGSQEDIDTWLPTFIDHINHQIDDRLGAVAPVSGHLDKFNFYYTTMQGVASSKTLPNDLTKISTFAGAYVILHTAVRQDSTDGTPPIYTAEGSLALDQGRSFIHESGHGIFEVADEYDGITRYFQPNPYPNIWDTQADGRTDAAGEYAVPVNGEVLGVGDGTKVQFGPIANGNSPNAANTFFADTDIDNDVDSSDVRVYIDAIGQETNTYGINLGNGIVTFNSAPPTKASVTIDYSYVKDEDWNPFQIQKFTDRLGDWWKLGTTRYIMYSGEWFAINGWGKPAARRIQWFLDQYADGNGATAASPQPEKSIWLNLEVSEDEFHLIDESYIIDSPPDYLPGTHDFTAKVFSTSGELLGEYGFNDPRRIMAELGYDGPTWLDSTNFQVILPYFNRGGRVDLTESATGSVKLSVDISKYVTPEEDVTPPTITEKTPLKDQALQDGVVFSALASDPSGVDWVTFSIRLPNGEYGTIIDPILESMPAQHVGDDEWQLPFDTNNPMLPDGSYVFLIKAADTYGNEGNKTVEFSIRNWACLELLPATKSNKAGRTMPVKFSLRVFEIVDPAVPFVYNEELTIVIYEAGDPDNILQTSTYGDTARDYRIDSIGELYITNFRTTRNKLTTYVVEVYRKDMLIGWFTFETVK